MGLCYSLRSRLAAAHPSAPYGSRGEPDTPAAAEHGDPQVRHRLRQDLVAKERADKKRSKSIDKTLKAEKREYKQTHRLLLLGERGGAVRPGPAGAGPEAAAGARAGGGGGGRGGTGAGRARTWRRRRAGAPEARRGCGSAGAAAPGFAVPGPGYRGSVPGRARCRVR